MRGNPAPEGRQNRKKMKQPGKVHLKGMGVDGGWLLKRQEEQGLRERKQINKEMESNQMQSF